MHIRVRINGCEYAQRSVRCGIPVCRGAQELDQLHRNALKGEIVESHLPCRTGFQHAEDPSARIGLLHHPCRRLVPDPSVLEDAVVVHRMRVCAGHPFPVHVKPLKPDRRADTLLKFINLHKSRKPIRTTRFQLYILRGILTLFAIQVLPHKPLRAAVPGAIFHPPHRSGLAPGVKPLFEIAVLQHIVAYSGQSLGRQSEKQHTAHSS